MTPNLTLHASWTRPGGGYRWCLDVADRQLQLGPVLLTRLPAGPPLIDRLELARTTQQGNVTELASWAVDWTGVAIRPLGLAVSVRYGTGPSRWLRSWDGRRQRRAQRARERRGDVPVTGSLGLFAPIAPRYDFLGADSPLDTYAAHGYVEGGALDERERPWPIGWETAEVWTLHPLRPHEWERVVVTQPHGVPEAVVRCSLCHVPRCGHSTDPDPCMRRRHHREEHLRLSSVTVEL